MEDEQVLSEMNDAEMMKRDHLWPQMLLPLKRPNPDGSPSIQTALLYDPAQPGEKWVVHVNDNLFGAMEDVELVEYDSAEAIVDDGWRVD